MNFKHEINATRRRLFILFAIVIIALMAIHIVQYFFLTDDAFISFRYARHLADGNGLVFNIGERVEGYTNFLWVLILSGLNIFGIPPEIATNVLSILLTFTLLGVVIAFSRRFFAVDNWELLILIAPFFLALNRSFAVWSTSGLETRLFTTLIFAAVYFYAISYKEDTKLKYSIFFFSLASLTRPEGILLFSSFYGFYLISEFKHRHKLQNFFKYLPIFIILVGGHFIFRYIYYGYPFPNTFYAKVTGAWFDSGFLYLFTFIHEYGLYLLIPLLIPIFTRFYDAQKRRVIISTIAPLIPYLIYLAYLGGDHFEFRPLDVLIPFIALLLQEGIRASWSLLKAKKIYSVRAITAVYLLLLIIFLTVPAMESHINFPQKYGSAIGVESSKPNGSLINQIPGLRNYLEIFDNLHGRLASNFVCIRQEEHKMALNQIFIPQAKLISSAIKQGYIDPKESICLWCVGAIPYYSGLTTIDYLGLTDAHVAHRKLPESSGKLMAHEKRADYRYLQHRRVAYISTKPSIFIFPREEYFVDDNLIKGKLPKRAYLVPFGDFVIVFRSVFLPGYFINKYGPRNIDFYYRDKIGHLNYYPKSTPKNSRP